MITALDLSASGLAAQRVRLTAIANNLANMSTLLNEQGEPEPYRPRFVIFQADERMGSALGAAGVRVSSVEVADVEPRYKYEPGHPYAIQEGPWQGYVAYPNINMMGEFTDALEATRAYEANLGLMEVAKDLAQQTLRLLV
ncbi:MAG: flagellar basal body rod protein FlgC [Pirellulales bacterium]|jgi:flagellar basal-body rod protein FlgC|nr:flagellar basal body rod protein FlgC [Pirellulales bacterium]